MTATSLPRSASRRHTAAPNPPLPPVTTAAPRDASKSLINGVVSVPPAAPAVALWRYHELLVRGHDVCPLAHGDPPRDPPLVVAASELVDVAEAGGEVAPVVVGRVTPVVRDAVGLAVRGVGVAVDLDELVRHDV